MSKFTSLHGRRLGLGENDQLVSNDIDISQPCVNAVITVSAEGATVANQRDITIQLNDASGDAITYVEEIELVMFLTADRLAYMVTGGSTGIAAGTDGALQTILAKKVFRVTSEATGSIDVIYTDTGTEAGFIGVRLPNGRYIMSDAITNA